MNIAVVNAMAVMVQDALVFRKPTISWRANRVSSSVFILCHVQWRKLRRMRCLEVNLPRVGCTRTVDSFPRLEKQHLLGVSVDPPQYGKAK